MKTLFVDIKNLTGNCLLVTVNWLNILLLIVLVDAKAFPPELIGKLIFWLGRYEKSSDES